MTPLERAAEAIIAEVERQGVSTLPPLWDDEINDVETGVLRIDGAVSLKPIVCAVLQAIREPSEAMIEGGAFFSAGVNPDAQLANASQAWQLMVDLALDNDT